MFSIGESQSPRGEQVTVIRPRSGWQAVDFKELIDYRDLFVFLVWRDIKVLYAQTILGFSWAILQPLIQIVIFTIVFGKVAKIDTDGIPYVLFSSVAIIPWAFMSQAMTASSQSLVTGQSMLGKVYFPRLIYPLTPVFAKLVDFSISLFLIIPLFVYFGIVPSRNLLLFPLFITLMILLAAGVGIWLSAMAIRFRDVKFAMPFLIQMLMYTAPIVYSSSSIPENLRILYSLNPLVGIIEGVRAVLLGLPLAWEFIVPGLVTAVVLFVSGVFYFHRMERVFVDVI